MTKIAETTGTPRDLSVAFLQEERQARAEHLRRQRLGVPEDLALIHGVGKLKLILLIILDVDMQF